ncbi:MAG: OmpA family protein [Bacteroidales bacterium]|nr:OmpA family protein [Bacteroidales bacterium]
MKHYKNIILIFTIVLMFSGLKSFSQKDYAAPADEAFDNLRYTVAIEKYKKAYSKVKGNKIEKDRISYQMAECYRLTNNLRRAESRYKRLVKDNYQDSKPLILLHYANILKSNEKYELALEQYNAYSKLVPDDPRGQNGITACEYITEWIENPTKHEIEEIKKLNSRESDFTPAWGSDNYNSLIFTSTREGSTGKNTDEWTDQNFSDLFYSKQDRKGEWSTPVLLETGEEGVNTESNEGTPILNSKFNSMYFTRCPDKDKTVAGCQIYKSKRSGRNWGEPEIIMLGHDTNATIGHPAISENELIIYFSSNRQGGFGGKDIWVAFRETKDEEFGRPQNLGPVVNSAGDEMFPYLRSDTVLYFSSNGHPGMGGLDIFRTTVNEDGNWGKPENLKFPLNSNGDDFSIIFHPEKEFGYFSSNRNSNRGNDDLFSFNIPPVEFTISGVIKDDRTLQFIENAVVELIDSDGISVSTKTTYEGKYYFGKNQVNEDKIFDITITKDDYFTVEGSETTIGLEKSKDFTRDFMMQPIPDEPIVLPEILYDLAKWNLKPQYQDSLQGLIETLDANENIIVELAAHTDARDSYERNDILSQKRAQSAVDYLIMRGIDPERLVAKGYGERVPLTLMKNITRDGFNFTEGTELTEDYIASLDSDEEKEAAHQLNRRTEFMVISKDFVPKPQNKNFEPTVDIVVNPEQKILKYTSDANTGEIQALCIINGFTLGFTYDKNGRAMISLEKALELLKNGAISKSDFIGDINKVLAESTIANNAVFKIKDLRIAGQTIHDINIIVRHDLRQSLILGSKVLSEIGEISIDKGKKEMIFK